ncbi:hypothetical protein OS493_012078 [Desmophyllum pertusum]|uniref:Uncharacterized protein n=1 Tax=Desmophyllum pertusum TaxID=174260 RepID=A0A9X0A2V1_9CNID|nr:hypothetical protein OS493_012078 [Desmophyllum pertusum]
MPRFLRPAAEPVEDVNPQPAEQPANVQAIAPENEENQDVWLRMRGCGTCPQCHEEFLNRTKPPNCPKCGHFLGGTFQSVKKAKANNLLLVQICQVVFSCRTTGRDDRCFVTSCDQIWLCTQEDCKISRSVHVNTGLVEEYECDNVKPAKNQGICSDPVAVYHPDLSNYPCSDTVRQELSEVVSSLPTNTPRLFKCQSIHLQSLECRQQAILWGSAM